MDKAIYARAILAEMLGGYARWPELVKRVPLALNTDCRSLYDHLKRDAGTPAEKRVALDLLDVRAELQEGTSVGWVNTHRMLADALTKPLSEEEVTEHVKMCGSSSGKSRHPIAPRIEAVEGCTAKDEAEAGNTANVIRW